MNAIAMHLNGEMGVSERADEMRRDGIAQSKIEDRFWEHYRFCQFCTHYAPTHDGEKPMEHYASMLRRRDRLFELINEL